MVSGTRMRVSFARKIVLCADSSFHFFSFVVLDSSSCRGRQDSNWSKGGEGGFIVRFVLLRASAEEERGSYYSFVCREGVCVCRCKEEEKKG